MSSINGAGAMAKKILFIIAQKNFRDEELLEPKKVLEQAGFQVVIASETNSPAEGMRGTQVKPDISFSEAYWSVNDFVAAVVVGGSGALGLINNSFVSRILKEMDKSKKVLAAICLGPIVLARNGVLLGRRATVSHSDLDSESVRALKANGAIFVENEIVEDGRFITASGPRVSVDFGKTLLFKLRQ